MANPDRDGPHRRQPVPQEPQGAALWSGLGAGPEKESPYGSHARAFTQGKRRKAQHGAQADQPPTSLGKNTVSSAFGSSSSSQC